jgi:hypothetical protein
MRGMSMATHWGGGLLLAWLAMGCTHGGGVGDRCRINSDCDPGLFCAPGDLVCTATAPSRDATAGTDGGAACGDDSCDTGETCLTCPQDCGMCMTSCGDTSCELPETCTSCPADCGACAPTCPDGACDPTESCATCAADCGACAPVCPNGACEPGESCMSCNADCGACPPSCPNGACDGAETCAACPMDCGACPVCGNGVLESGELCDDGAANALSADCLPDCTANACGDGNVDTAGPAMIEQCDPPGGACDAGCQVSAADCAQGIGGLVCGGVVSGNNGMVGSTDVDVAYACIGYTESGPEVAYAFLSPVDTSVTFMLSGLAADLDLMVLSGAPACDAATCVAVSDRAGTADELVTLNAVAGVSYYLVVEGYAGATSDFTLAAACQAPAPTGAGTCASPYLVDLAGPGAASYFVDLCGAGDDSSAPALADCAGAGIGEDVVYQLDLGFDAALSLDLNDFDAVAAVDAVLYLRSVCASTAGGAQLACNDDVNGTVRHAHVDTMLAAGTYYLVADSSNYTDAFGGIFACGTVRLVLQAQ